MKKILKILFSVGVIGVFISVVAQHREAQAYTTRHYGQLTITYLNVPLGVPIFTITNIYPGAPKIIRTIKVKNSSGETKIIAVKGVKNGPEGQSEPFLESGLNLEIKEGVLTKFMDVLADFFEDSTGSDGVPLGTVNPGQTKYFDFIVEMPMASGNDYQKKSVVFDIVFGTLASEDLVINEVMYAPKNGRDWDGRSRSRFDRHDKNDKDDGKAEWIEIYNPTSSVIPLKNWILESSEGKVKIKSHKFIRPGQFVLISKDDDIFHDWHGKRDALNIEVGNWFDRGLDTTDHLKLINPAGTEIDFVAWGGESGWNLFASKGQSIERASKGADTDVPSDWLRRLTPTPGR